MGDLCEGEGWGAVFLDLLTTLHLTAVAFPSFVLTALADQTYQFCAFAKMEQSLSAAKI